MTFIVQGFLHRNLDDLHRNKDFLCLHRQILKCIIRIKKYSLFVDLGFFPK